MISLLFVFLSEDVMIYREGGHGHAININPVLLLRRFCGILRAANYTIQADVHDTRAKNNGWTKEGYHTTRAAARTCSPEEQFHPEGQLGGRRESGGGVIVRENKTEAERIW